MLGSCLSDRGVAVGHPLPSAACVAGQLVTVPTNFTVPAGPRHVRACLSVPGPPCSARSLLLISFSQSPGSLPSSCNLSFCALPSDSNSHCALLLWKRASFASTWVGITRTQGCAIRAGRRQNTWVAFEVSFVELVLPTLITQAHAHAHSS